MSEAQDTAFGGRYSTKQLDVEEQSPVAHRPGLLYILLIATALGTSHAVAQSPSGRIDSAGFIASARANYDWSETAIRAHRLQSRDTAFACAGGQFDDSVTICRV
jgi:hypothetical protein